MKKKTNDRHTLAGGAEMKVTLRDGEKETVFVRQLPVNDYEKFALALGDEVEQLALYCNRPAAWVQNLSPESHSEVAEKGDEINLAFFHSWMKRRNRRMEMIRPGWSETVKKQVDNAIAALRPSGTESPSPSSSPTSPPSAG